VTVGGSGDFSFSAGVAGDGRHTVLLTATDKVGNVSTKNLSFTLDTGKPSINIATPAIGSTITPNPTFSGTITDALSGVASLQARVDGGAWAPETVDGSGHYSFVAAVTTPGSHTVELKAFDKAGNAATASLTFTLT
jgi:hypothetical protein